MLCVNGLLLGSFCFQLLIGESYYSLRNCRRGVAFFFSTSVVEGKYFLLKGGVSLGLYPRRIVKIVAFLFSATVVEGKNRKKGFIL